MFQNILTTLFWGLQVALVVYIEFTGRSDPNALNEKVNSVLLIYSMCGTWDLIAFVTPAIFFAGKPSRRRNFDRFVRETLGIPKK